MRRATAFAALILLPLALGGLVALAIGAPWASSTGSASPNGSMSCSVKPACATSEVAVLRMSSTGNAHAGTPYGSAYGQRVCCTKISGLGTECTGVHDVVLTLSAPDNAHVASDGSYATEVCLSGGDDAIVGCTYGPTCDGDYVCLATISGSTNAHLADCDGVDDYATRVCCLATPDNCPDVSNPGQANADGDDWGDACDNCSTVATVWYVPAGDDDCDGFTTAAEEYVGTDPLDACPETSTPNDEDPDAWPVDMDDDQDADIADVLKFKPLILAGFPCVGDPAYDSRFDFNANGCINIADVLLYKPFILTSCTP